MIVHLSFPHEDVEVELDVVPRQDEVVLYGDSQERWRITLVSWFIAAGGRQEATLKLDSAGNFGLDDDTN